MSDPHPSTESEADRDATDERSSGEEQLEREEELKREEQLKREEHLEREDRSIGEERPADAEAAAEEEAEEDAEEVESEWHVWILALVVVAGVVLFFAPRFFLPELLGTLGAFLVLAGVLGWGVKWAIERSA